MTLCGVIPAAGRGSRLGSDRPKLLTPLTDNLTVWDVLKSKLLGVCDHVVVVMSTWGEPFLQDVLRYDTDRGRISVAVQEKPVGMGDAVMQGNDIWQSFDDICVIWGDQVHVSRETLLKCADTQKNTIKPCLTLPLVRSNQPYVEYIFDSNRRLINILQTREGDICKPGGLCDVGTFFLSTPMLRSIWLDYERISPKGILTGEINFLPFIVYLIQQGWGCEQVIISDCDEAKGINTPDDLKYFKNLYNYR